MWRKKAQSLAEYTICLTVVLVALIAINTYVKRGLQGRYVDVANSAVTAVGAVVGDTNQFEPLYRDDKITTAQDAQLKKEGLAEGQIKTDTLKDEVTQKGNLRETID